MSTMRRINDPQAPLSLDSQTDEDRVRRALGLKSGVPHQHQQRPEQARQRHRFVSDGAVPVVMLNRADGETSGLKEKLAAAETALDHERSAHAATRRALAEAQAAHQAAETRRIHAELAHKEALASEAARSRQAEEALLALRAEHPAPRKEAVEPRPVRKARKIRAAAIGKDPKPVRWWTPSYRAKQT